MFDDQQPPKDPENLIKLDATTVDALPLWRKVPPRMFEGQRLCGLPWCNKHHYSVNLCVNHYQMNRVGNLDPVTGLGKRESNNAAPTNTKRAESLDALQMAQFTSETEFPGFGKLKDWIYVGQTQEFVNLNDFTRISIHAAKQVIGPVVHSLIRNGKFKVYRKQIFKPFVEDLHHEDEEKPVEQDFNAFRLESVMRIKEHSTTLPPQLRELLKNLSGGGDHQQYLEQWLAYTYNHYGEAGCALILHGVHGSGKSVLALLLSKIFGPYMGTITVQDIEEKHNSWLENKLLLCAEELMSGSFRDRVKMMNVMKKFISGGKLFINRKMVPQYEYDNQARWLVFSNAGAAGNDNAVPVVIEPTERRYSLIKCHTPLSKETGYQIGCQPEFYAQALVNYLSTVDLTGFVNWQCYDNDDLAEAKALSEKFLK